MSAHNKGQRCTKQNDCGCAKCCLCYACIFERRSLSMYSGMRGRFAAKKWKSGARAGTVRKEKIDIPFTLQEFRAWLTVVLEDTPFCEYCKCAIDINTISPDHKIPISRGGSLERANLAGTCVKCNTRKGKLTGKEFMFLRKCVETMPEAARSDIWKRMGGGIKFMGSPKSVQQETPLKAGNILVIPAPKEGKPEPKASNILVVPKQKEIW